MEALSPIRTWPDTVPPDNRTLGWQVLEWTTAYLLQPDGPAAGDMWEFTAEQARVLLRWYEVDDRGRFTNRRGVLRRLKGWGKDPFTAALAAVEACGPCRFGGWDARGNPVAVPVTAPWVQIAAVSKDQTRNTMTLFPGMLSDAALSEFKIDLGKELIYVNGYRGRIEAVTSSPRALEGGRASFVIQNETHHWIFSNEGHEMAAVIRRNLSKSRDGSARALEITNAHLPGEGSVQEATYNAWVEGGGVPEGLPGVYFDSVEAPPVEDLKDTERVIAALKAARGDSTWLDVERLAAEIADPTEDEGKSRRFYLNQVTKRGSHWLPDGTWEACAGASEIPEHTPVVLAFDGSYNGDCTALVAVTIPQDGELPTVAVAGCWLPDPWDPVVDIDEVEETIRECARRWEVRELIADPYRWARSLQVLESEGLPAVEFPQSATRMIPATERFYKAAVAGDLRHTDDDRLNLHVANCTVKEDSRGFRLAKETKTSPNKIDLAVAAVMGFDRAMTLATDPDGVPSVHSLAELVAEMRREAAEAVQEPTQPQEGPRVPTVTFHKF